MKKLITLLFLFGTLCTTAQVKIPSLGEGSIAPEFPVENSILVVFKVSKKSINKYLEKNLEKYYKGEYRLLELGESLSPKDTSNTRFFVMAFDRASAGRFTPDGGREGPQTSYIMTMTDRKTNFVYYYPDASSCYNCLFKDYFIKLENLRVGGKK